MRFMLMDNQAIRGETMKNDMKRIILILAFILCFGISACGRGSSDGYDAEDS